MPEGRPNIPSKLKRELMIECGYRCAICKTPEPTVFEHIEEWSKVKEHTFENMIVLCANCHQRKSTTANPKKIDHIALKKIKSDLMEVNGRYSDLERRILEQFAYEIRKWGKPDDMEFPRSLSILLRYLQNDGMISIGYPCANSTNDLTRMGFRKVDTIIVSLKPEGRKYIEKSALYQEMAHEKINE